MNRTTLCVLLVNWKETFPSSGIRIGLTTSNTPHSLDSIANGSCVSSWRWSSAVYVYHAFVLAIGGQSLFDVSFLLISPALMG